MSILESNFKTDIKNFDSIEDILQDFADGKMVIMLDNEDRENEGDLIIAAEKATPEAINFMIKYGRGLVCLILTEERCKQLDLELMVPGNNNLAPFGTRFTVSIEAAHGVTTGISASDRAKTIAACIKQDAKPCDIVKPGHMFPIMAQPGGVLTRPGHTEACIDLAKLSGYTVPAAVLVEILNDDGSMARRDDLLAFAAVHNLKIGSIADLIRYRLDNNI
ncbi:MAG: 3,4-dihydroxy-2-butanone-4-phosphate synthase [Gammaproteobacteria bacterium]|nr:3,4-dihydroxy-2-butanone-4-phosphate synthase [Gammaproteobacteria bacterium]